MVLPQGVVIWQQSMSTARQGLVNWAGWCGLSKNPCTRRALSGWCGNRQGCLARRRLRGGYGARTGLPVGARRKPYACPGHALGHAVLGALRGAELLAVGAESWGLWFRGLCDGVLRTRRPMRIRVTPDTRGPGPRRAESHARCHGASSLGAESPRLHD